MAGTELVSDLPEFEGIDPEISSLLLECFDLDDSCICETRQKVLLALT